MDTVLIATTRQEGLHAIGTGGQPVVQAYDQIVRDLRQNLSEEHARLFAEPNYNPARGTVDWYAPADGAVVRYAEADPALREAVGEKLNRLQADIRNRAAELGRSVHGGDRLLGQLLDMALEIPGEDYIHCVGDRPVLVAWGNLVDQAQPQRGVLRKFVPYHAPPATAAAPAAAGLMPGGPVPAYAGVGAAAVAAEQPLYWLMWLLWLLFGLLAAAIFVLLLSGCGITWPWSDWLRSQGIVNYCVIPVAESAPSPLVDAERSRQRVLQDTLTRLQLRLAVERRRCDSTRAATPAPTTPVPATPVPATPSAPVPPADSTPPANAAPGTPESPQSQTQAPFDERLRREGGHQGEVTITLTWNSDADLDLHVLCPSGARLYYANRQACGGQLDVDMNVGGRMSREPVENIVWREGAASPGRYVVIVNNFNSRSDGDQPTPFHVRVIRPGETRVFDGALRHQDGDVRVYEFTLP